jgi:hypothetical protein
MMMMKKSKYERLIVCHACNGDGVLWDILLCDWTIACSNCVGEGNVCGVCLKDLVLCDGKGECYDEDLDAEWSAIEEYS